MDHLRGKNVTNPREETFENQEDLIYRHDSASCELSANHSCFSGLTCTCVAPTAPGGTNAGPSEPGPVLVTKDESRQDLGFRFKTQQKRQNSGSADRLHVTSDQSQVQVDSSANEQETREESGTSADQNVVDTFIDKLRSLQ
ncbi:hypothetical protein WMY93_014013 [Mugilogobius chulae]|uniref:Uncharacterized protein n=1 Tax=Mugilogobius chulae TaxID=88201 RepID=A0AAW0NUE2_9GOBI